MNGLLKQYAELVSLTQLFLFKEHQMKDCLLSFPKEKAFFLPKLKSESFKKAEVHTSAMVEKRPLPPLKFSTRQPSPDSHPEPLPLPPQAPLLAPLPSTTTSEHSLPLSKPAEGIQTKSDSSKGLPLLTLEPLNAHPFITKDHGFTDILKKTFPHYQLSESIPDDGLAKKLMNAWSLEQSIPPVIILSFNEKEKPLALLKNLAKAITLRFAPARVMSALKLEKEKQWDALLKTAHLRLIIASDYGLYLQPILMTHYREASKQAKHFLDQTPLLLLSDLNLYLKEPQLKSLLWRAICNEFAVSPLAR